MKSALVTGGRGFVGAWLCKALLERGRRGRLASTGAAPREKPSTLAMLGIEGQVESSSDGDLVDGELLRRTIAEHEIDTVFHLAAETIVGTVQADPVGGFETNVRGTWTLLEAAPGAGVERVVVASSDKAYGAHDELPYREDFALQPTRALRGLEGGRRSDRPLLLALLRPAGRGHPLRQHLRRRRPQLLPAGPRGGLRRDRRPRAGAALRRLAGPRPPLRRGRRRAPTWRSPTRSTATRSAARRSTPAASAPTACSRSSRRSPGSPGPASSPTSRAPATPRARSTSSTSMRPRSASSAAGRPRSRSRRESRGRCDWYRSNPEARPA